MARQAFAVETLLHGEQLYTDLLAEVRQDQALVKAMWADAESRPDELDLPGTHWTVTLTEDGTPAAWCAARIIGATIKCHSNYEVRSYRGRRLYEAAHHGRHRTVILPYGLPAVTYLFEQPIALHEEKGWRRTGLTGIGEIASHRWSELHRVVVPRTRRTRPGSAKY